MRFQLWCGAAACSCGQITESTADGESRRKTKRNKGRLLHGREPNLQTAILCLWERLNAPVTDTRIPVNIQVVAQLPHPQLDRCDPEAEDAKQRLWVELITVLQTGKGRRTCCLDQRVHRQFNHLTIC